MHSVMDTKKKRASTPGILVILPDGLLDPLWYDFPLSLNRYPLEPQTKQMTQRSLGVSLFSCQKKSFKMWGLKRKLFVQECHITAIFRVTTSRQWLGYIIMIIEILIDLCLPVNIIIPCYSGEIFSVKQTLVLQFS